MSLSRRRPDHIHFIGIGGSGMSGLAEVLFNLGYSVTGSDIDESSITDRLKSLGIKIKKEHSPSNLDIVDMVVVSSAIEENNPELKQARKLLLPVLKRAELLSSLMNMKRAIAVSGTHGKTTTTSLLATIMTEAMLDPTFIVGGIVNSFATNAKLGRGDYLIAEADESDGSFLMLQPSMTILTNIDSDHLENFDYKIENLELAFVNFVKKLPFNGLAIVCGDDTSIKKLIPSFSRQVVTYGFKKSNDYIITEYVSKELKSEFFVKSVYGNDFRVKLNLPGKHNALNALAASIAALEEGISVINIQSALEKFSGIARRIQTLGEIQSDKNKILLLDDYGHHPTELKMTLEAIRESFPGRSISMVFQPHRYSRTKLLYKEFIQVLQLPDELLLLQIYPAGEKEIKGITSKFLAEGIKKAGYKKVRLAESELSVLSFIEEKLKEKNGIILFQGAGDISYLSKKVMDQFS